MKQTISIVIPECVTTKLERLGFLQRGMKYKVDQDSLFVKEIEELRDELALTFIPVIECMITARLITVQVRMTEQDHLNFSDVLSRPTEVSQSFFDNNIWLDCYCVGGCLKSAAPAIDESN